MLPTRPSWMSCRPQAGSRWHPVMTLSKARIPSSRPWPRNLAPTLRDESQLAIYGLAEARLVDVDLAILGGLCEGAWPEHPDSGPWLNRPMRDAMKLQQPERDIGVTAHDFVQAFAIATSCSHGPSDWGRSCHCLALGAAAAGGASRPSGSSRRTCYRHALPAMAQRLDAPTSSIPSGVHRSSRRWRCAPRRSASRVWKSCCAIPTGSMPATFSNSQPLDRHGR